MHHFLWWLGQVGIGLAIAVGFVLLVYGMCYFSEYMAGHWPTGKP